MKKNIIILCMFSVTTVFAQNVKKVEVQNLQKLDVSKPLRKDTIDLYNQSFVKFVTALKSSDKSTVNSLISDKVKTIVNDKIIKKLSEGIHFDKKTQVYQSGYQSLLDGVVYPAIEYKYEGDHSNPPKDLITVIFENDGKILGVKPNQNK